MADDWSIVLSLQLLQGWSSQLRQTACPKKQTKYPLFYIPSGLVKIGQQPEEEENRRPEKKKKSLAGENIFSPAGKTKFACQNKLPAKFCQEQQQFFSDLICS